MLKVGEKIVCKKSLSKNDLHWIFNYKISVGTLHQIYPGKVYKIVKVNDYTAFNSSVSIDIEDKIVDFYLSKHSRIQLYNYFYTNKELRKEKLLYLQDGRTKSRR